MSYNLKYSASFPDTENATITLNIKEIDFVGSVTDLSDSLAGEPITITYTNGDILDNIIGCGAEINIINRTGDLEAYNNLFANPETDYLVEILKGSQIIYSGYIVPEMYEQNLQLNSFVTIPTSSYLSLLDRYTPYSLSAIGSGYTYVTLIQLIKECLSFCVGGAGLLISTTLENWTYKPFDPNPTTMNIFDKNFVLRDVYIEGDGVYKNCNDVLTSILKAFGCRIYQYHNYLVIDRIKDLGITDRTYKWYDITGTTTGTTTFSRPIIELRDHNFTSKTGKLKYTAGKKNVVLKLNQKNISNMVTSSFVDIDQTYDIRSEPPFCYDWKIHSFLNTTQYPVNKNYSDSQITNGIKYYTDFAYLTTRIEFGVYQTGVTCSLNVKYKTLPVSKPAQTHGKHTLQMKTIYRLRLPYDSSFGYYEYIGYDKDTSSYFVFWDPDPVQWIGGKPVQPANSLRAKTLFTKLETDVPKNGYTLNVDDTHDITPIIPQLTDDINKIVLFYEISHVMWKYSDESDYYWRHAYSVTGDVALTVKTEFEENEITGTINNNFTGRIDYDIDIWDTYNLTLANGLYWSPSSPWGWTQNRFTGYTDSYYTTPYYLPYVLISDIIQLYNKPRYIITGDIQSTSSRTIGMGDLFTHGAFYNDDDTLKTFILTGLEYNLRKNAYRMVLSEFKMDDDFRIPELEPPPAPDYFYLNESNMFFSKDSAYATVSIYSTYSWTGVTYDSWVTLAVTHATGDYLYDTLDIQTNLGDDPRTTVIQFTNGSTYLNLYIHQDGQINSI